MASYHLSIKTDRRPSGTKIHSADHADYICREGKYKGIDQTVKAPSHAEYINRESNYEKKGGCVYKSHQLPAWAEQSPQKFFAAADQYEAPTRVRYREIEFALPNELPLAQNKEIVQEFIDCHLKDFYFAYAIHEKDAVLDEGQRNIHVHIMFSERKIDEIERDQERSPELFFKKANAKNPARGGAKKDGRWNGSFRARHLHQVRLDCARIQNKILHKYGHDVEVDHRALKVQWDEAKKKGDLDLASLLDRAPEEHLGPQIAANPDHPQVIALKKYRALRREHKKLLEAAEALQQAIASDRAELEISASLHASGEVLSDIDAKGLAGYSALEAMKKNIVATAQALSTARAQVLYYHEARKIARYELLSDKERAIEAELRAVQADLAQLEKMKKSFMSQTASAEEQRFANSETEILTAQICQNQERAKKLTRALQQANRRFTTKEFKSKLTKKTREILAANQPCQQKAQDLRRQLDGLVKETRAYIYDHILKTEGQALSVRSGYTAKQIKAILDPLIVGLQYELSNMDKDIEFLSKKIISPERAYQMAKNVFVKGAYKTCREKQRELEKEAGRIAQAFDERQKFAYALSQTPQPKWYHSNDAKKAYKEKKRHLDELDRAIALRKHCLEQERKKLAQTVSGLDKKCETPFAKDKINRIAASIIEKNSAYRRELDEKLTNRKAIKEQILELRKLKNGVDERVKLDAAEHPNRNIQYHLKNKKTASSSPIVTQTSLPPAVHLIAKALNQDPKAAALVARIADDEQIDYEALSELDKKVLRMKQL